MVLDNHLHVVFVPPNNLYIMVSIPYIHCTYISYMPLAIVHYTHITSSAQWQWRVLELTYNLRKVHAMTPKWSWHFFQGQKYPYPLLHTLPTRAPNFHQFRSTVCHFRVAAQFWEVHQMIPKWPWHTCKIQNQIKVPVCTQNILMETKNFNPFQCMMSCLKL